MNWISSHDLQEPLRKMQLISSHLLYEDKVSESVHHSLTRLNLSAERMRTLLQDILKYTRLKYSEDDFELVNIDKLVHEVADELSDGADSIRFEMSNLPTIPGVPFFLKQLFSNLLSNSIKYSKADVTPIIQIAGKKNPKNYPTAEDKPYHVISVKDNGIGFDQKYAESIFNVFKRLHLSSEYSGSGVGLALCKKIVKNHNGHITAKSTPGKGTEITLYFPTEQ